MPGIGTAIGSTVGSGVDTALNKISGPIQKTIAQGIELNKQLELTKREFTTFAGTEQEAARYLADLKKLSIDTGNDFGWVIDTSEHIFDLTQNLDLTNTILKAATDHAADFGGEAETIRKVGEALGLIAEKGSVASRELQKLYKLGIDARKYLAQATGLKEREIDQLMAEDRLRGDVAARLIAEGIEREKAGFAAKLAQTTVAGAERRFSVLTQVRAAEGTEKATQGIGDFYRAANRMLEGQNAQQFVQYIDQATGSLINLVETGLSTGLNLTKGLADGIVSGDGFRAVGAAVTSLGDYTTNKLKSFFEIQSPAELPRREIGVPIGEGIAQGMADGFLKRFGQTKEEIVAELNKLLQDPRVKAFFEAIRRAEGGDTNIIVGGKRFSDLSRHPNIVGLRTEKGPSTAAGSFQITGTNWYGKKGRPGLKDRLGLPDFSQHSQELAALFLFAQRDGGAGLRALLSGDLNTAMAVAAKDWTSTPGSTIGGGRQIARSRWLGHYNSALAGITKHNPMPVAVVNWNVPDFDNASRIFQTQKPQVPQQPVPDLSDYTLVLGEEDAAIVDVIASKEQLIQTDRRTIAEMRQLINMSSIVPRALTPLIGAEQQHAQTAIKLTEEYQEAARKQLVIGRSVLTQLSGALGQIGALMPQQQVGKKRGFWSKLLGFAAPFLSFIPGVGPILSQVAGIASAGLGGNWSGVATGIAGGLQPGGVFRSSSTTATPTNTTTRPRTVERRAAGGSGVRARVYWTGEHGPEPFLAPDDGRFLSHSDAMQAMSGSGGSGAALHGAIERLTSVIARLESMPAHDVVRMGARGVIDAFDQDAGLIRLAGQRFRFA
jgi:muramidase (phage lysozyme)